MLRGQMRQWRTSISHSTHATLSKQASRQDPWVLRGPRRRSTAPARVCGRDGESLVARGSPIQLVRGHCPECSLTPRSRGAPTACHQGPACGASGIFTGRALAACRRRPLTSNVRRRKMLLQCANRVSACGVSKTATNFSIPEPPRPHGWDPAGSSIPMYRLKYHINYIHARVERKGSE
jgi:hypothetical protein